MTISLEAQGQAFLLTLGMGALLGLYYDLLRLPRLLLPTGSRLYKLMLGPKSCWTCSSGWGPSSCSSSAPPG